MDPFGPHVLRALLKLPIPPSYENYQLHNMKTRQLDNEERRVSGNYDLCSGSPPGERSWSWTWEDTDG